MLSTNQLRTYKKVTHLQGVTPGLSVEVFQGLSGTEQYLFRVFLMPLEWFEGDLRLGRFLRYVEHDLEWKCKISLPAPTNTDGVAHLVNWIHQYVRGKWSMDLQMANVNDGTLVFSFENNLEAIHFRLTH